MTPPELDRLCGEAERRHIAVICGSTLRRAATCLGTPVPDAVLARLERHRTGTRQEPSARYARGPMRRLDVLLSDLRALDRWGDRAALLREHAFPPAGYVMGAYHVSNRAVLPALYVHRLVSGAWRWLRRAV
jgi:hypothetical protein